MTNPFFARIVTHRRNNGNSESRCRGWFGMLVPVTILALGLMALLPASVALAAERDFTLRYDVLAPGANLAQIGNAVTTCQSGTNNLEYPSLSCAATRSGSNGDADRWYNDQYEIVFVDVDGDSSTFNSSTADLTLPSGATVLHAQLYWGGSFNPSTLWNQSLAQVMKLKGPTGSYYDVTATQLDYKDVTTGTLNPRTGRSYGATADVTNLFTANSAWIGASKTFTGANVKSTLGCTSGNSCSDTESAGRGSLGNYAGWSLLVVYQDPNDTTHVRYVGIDDGFKCVVGVGSSCPTDVTVSFTGFNVPAGSTGNRWGILAWDGDHGTGDNFYLNNVQQSDAAHPVNDYFRSRISVNGSLVTSRNPSYTNNLGIDIVESNTGNFPGGTTTVSGRFNTGGELVLLHYFWLVTESVVINSDYADAPSSFGSVSHQLSGNNSANNLRMGTAVTDYEAGMQHSVLADGDDLLNTDDEDGVVFPPLLSNATSYSVLVKATNNFGAAATLYGWIDLNYNGVFDANEFASIAVPNGTTDQSFMLSWNSFAAIPKDTVLYARFRLTTATLTGANATGSAPNGEVEDYRIVVQGTATASLLNSFTVKANAKAITVKWETGAEMNMLGFNVWRKVDDKEWRVVNKELIAAQQMGSVNGASYTFKDANIKPGKTYRYKLELVLTDGPSDWSKVVKVQTK